MIRGPKWPELRGTRPELHILIALAAGRAPFGAFNHTGGACVAEKLNTSRTFCFISGCRRWRMEPRSAKHARRRIRPVAEPRLRVIGQRGSRERSALL
jgi:hypothetical protein